MKVAMDGGVLCSPPGSRFGNFIFGQSFIKTFLEKSDVGDSRVYTFCKTAFERAQVRRLFPHFFTGQIAADLLFFKPDVYLALAQSLPPYLPSSTKMFFFSHGLSFFFYPSLYRKDYGRLMRQLEKGIRRADYIVVSSEKVKDEFKKYIYPKKKVVVLRFGVPLDILRFRGKRLSKENIILFVGKDQKIKRVDEAVSIFSQLRKKDKSFKLMLAGVERKYKEKNVFSLGYVERKELISLYRRSKFLLVTSLYESFHFPTLESFFFGSRVVAYPSAVIPELREHVFSSFSKDDIVRFIIENKDKPSLKIQKRLVAKFNWDSYVASLVKHF